MQTSTLCPESRLLWPTRVSSFKLFFVVALLVSVCLVDGKRATNPPREQTSQKDYKSLVLKTCRGCALKNYPSVVKFIMYDTSAFGDKVRVDDGAGGTPRLVVLNSAGEQTRVLDISKLNLSKIRQVVKQLGFEPVQPLHPLKYVSKKYKTDVLLRGTDDIKQQGESQQDKQPGDSQVSEADTDL